MADPSRYDGRYPEPPYPTADGMAEQHERDQEIIADLLNALKAVLPFAEHEMALAIPRDYRERVTNLVEAARAAIAKAEVG